MLTKDRKFIVRPSQKKGTKGPSFFELAMRHAVKGGKANRNLSKEIDKILYGA